MEMINTLISFLKNRNDTGITDAPEGYCPNCWGRQEYGGDFYEAIKNKHVDIKAKNPNVGWIQDYADKYLSGIALIEEKDDLICQTCKVKYKKK
jgi:hypothetical protein